MLKVSLALILAVMAVALAEPRVQQHRGLTADFGSAGHPYLFLTVPRGRAGAVVQGFEVLEENVDDDKINAADDNDDDNDADETENDNEDDDNEPNIGLSRAVMSDEEIEDDDDENENEDDDEMDSNDELNTMQVINSMKNSPAPTNLQAILQNAKPTQMMVAKDQAGAIMVPDGIIEIEGQRIIDEKTGKAALLVPREALDAIPDGSVVALMERSAGDLSDEEEEERANRVIVRRRRRGSRRNVRRRGGNRVNRRRDNNNNYNNKNRNTRRRRVNTRKVRVVRRGSNNRRRNGNRRRSGNRRVVYQG